MREGYTELLAVHDFDKVNGLEGPEHIRAKSTPWRMRMVAKVESRDYKVFEYFHEFHGSDYRQP